MEEKLKRCIGEQMFAIFSLQTQLETANAEIASLKAKAKSEPAKSKSGNKATES